MKPSNYFDEEKREIVTLRSHTKLISFPFSLQSAFSPGWGTRVTKPSIHPNSADLTVHSDGNGYSDKMGRSVSNEYMSNYFVE